MNQIHGTYRASDNSTYEYDATWNEPPVGPLWNATVLREGKAVAHPSGIIAVSGDRDPESLVRNAIHEAIERLTRAP